MGDEGYKNNEIRGFPGGSVIKHPLAMHETQEMWVQSPVWKDLLEDGVATHSSILF